MKKHPIDDLFERRLSRLGKEPSASAWLKIAKEARSTPSAPGWIRYAAASIFVVLLAGYAVWENSDPDFRPTRPANKVASAHIDQPAIANLVDKDSLLVSTAERPKKTMLVNENIAKRQAKEELKLLQEITTEDEKIDGPEKEVFAADLKEISSPDIDPKMEEMIRPEPEAIAGISVSEKPIEIQYKVESSRTVVVVIDTDKNSVQSSPKTSRFSKVFRQLKNVRAGEKVDWNEVSQHKRENKIVIC
jgi:hypothetical protein